MNLFVGEIVAIHEAETGRSGSVRVRGARMEVALDLVPQARVGDSVLVHAGVALSLLDDEDQEKMPCA